MPESLETLFSPLNTFLMGLGLGVVFLLLSLWGSWKTKREFKRYRQHLSDKLDLDAKNIQELNKERARLAQENEHLRLQVSRLNEKPDNKAHRELEILARAEKHMMINAPGFAPAWEMAKSQSMSQLETEEKGMSFPQRIFRKLMPGSNASTVALPEEAAATAAESAPASATAGQNGTKETA